MKRAAAFTLLFVLLAWPAASADYRGSDMLGNIGPSSQVQDGLAGVRPSGARAAAGACGAGHRASVASGSRTASRRP